VRCISTYANNGWRGDCQLSPLSHFFNTMCKKWLSWVFAFWSLCCARCVNLVFVFRLQQELMGLMVRVIQHCDWLQLFKLYKSLWDWPHKVAAVYLILAQLTTCSERAYNKSTLSHLCRDTLTKALECALEHSIFNAKACKSTGELNKICLTNAAAIYIPKKNHSQW